MRDYQLISPSLDGILRHDSLVYDGIQRPGELQRFMDSPRTRGRSKDGAHAVSDKTELVYTDKERKIIESYFTDLYSVFIKKLSFFFVEDVERPDDDIKLQAMLQEMVKVKRILTGKLQSNQII